MKHFLTKIINNLQTSEIRYFKLFSSNYRQKGGEKRTVVLFNELRKNKVDEYSDEIQLLFFDQANANGYYRIKNRLREDLESSLLSFHKGKINENKILNCIELSNIFVNRSMIDIAMSYLEEGEGLAIKLQRYDLLNIIYDRQIVLCNQLIDRDPAPYVRKKEKNHILYRQIQKIDLLLATVTYRLNQSNYSKKDLGVVDLLENVLEEFQLKSKESLSFDNRLKINKVVRNILLQKRDYNELGSFLESSYRELSNANVFTTENHEEKIKMHVWMFNTFSKLKKLEKCEHSIRQLKECIEDSVYYNKYVWLYYQSKTLLNVLNNTPQLAIQDLEELNRSIRPQYMLSELSINLNLAILYYYIKDMDSCFNYFSKVILSKEFSKISPYLQLNILVVELILRTDNGDFVYVNNKFKEIKRKFRIDLKKETYTKQSQFLDIFKKTFINSPDGRKLSSNKSSILSFSSKHADIEIASNELIDYSVWFKSKLDNNDYYSELLKQYFAS